MTTPQSELEKGITTVEKIRDPVMEQLLRHRDADGLADGQLRTAEILERELLARNFDLETALEKLARINAALEQANGEIDEANRAKSRFLRAASHDLLQPLSAAKFFLAHLEESITDPAQNKLVQVITSTLDSAVELIQSLSNIARLDGRASQMSRSAVSISELFRRLLLDIEPLAHTRGVALAFCPSSLTVESDPVFLRQIAQNLVINAVKYSDGAKVLVGMRRAKGQAWLEVHDAGPGIAPQDQARIFEEFERLSHEDQPGSGLGLSIVRRACQQLGHALELHSQIGRGSCFRVGLPILTHDAVKTRQSESEASPAETSRPDYHGLTFCVIDDDQNLRKAYTLLFEGWGCDIDVFANAPAALAAFKGSKPDLIITDYRLGGDQTGVDFLAQMAARHGAPLPALIITAEDQGRVRKEAKKLVSDVLSKPLSQTTLRRAIDRAIAQSKHAPRPRHLGRRFGPSLGFYPDLSPREPRLAEE